MQEFFSFTVCIYAYVYHYMHPFVFPEIAVEEGYIQPPESITDFTNPLTHLFRPYFSLSMSANPELTYLKLTL